jgi:hypothetical protein
VGNTTNPEVSKMPGSMRRANHGLPCLPIGENQDRRIEHQVRQVERREYRKRIRFEHEEAARTDALDPRLTVPPAMPPLKVSGPPRPGLPALSKRGAR